MYCVCVCVCMYCVCVCVCMYCVCVCVCMYCVCVCILTPYKFSLPTFSHVHSDTLHRIHVFAWSCAGRRLRSIVVRWSGSRPFCQGAYLCVHVHVYAYVCLNCAVDLAYVCIRISVCCSDCVKVWCIDLAPAFLCWIVLSIWLMYVYVYQCVAVIVSKCDA